MDRTLDQNAFSISDNFTWITGGHSLEERRALEPQHGARRVRFGVNFRGRYRFNARRTGNAFTDFLLGLPQRT